MKGVTMNKSIDNKYPIIRKGARGYWHAYGNGWAVCASSEEAVIEKYNEMQSLMNKLIALPPNSANDVL
jgi:hypothetical protein